MKFIKISLLILAPIGLAAMFSNAIYNLADHLHMLETGVNYLPLFMALAFFAFFGFLVPTANLIFPDATNSIEEIQDPIMPSLQPCIMQIVRTNVYNNSLLTL